jgi:hypothetical protein
MTLGDSAGRVVVGQAVKPHPECVLAMPLKRREFVHDNDLVCLGGFGAFDIPLVEAMQEFMDCGRRLLSRCQSVLSHGPP